MKPTEASASSDGGVRSAPQAFRVLIIDNDETERELTVRHLGKAWPFEHELAPDYAASSREALDKLHSVRYAFIVLDWRLPGLDGGDVLHAMRLERVLTPVIVISGMRREHITEKIESFGAVFLNKDEMTPLTLRRAIVTSLRQLGFDTAPAA